MGIYKRGNVYWVSVCRDGQQIRKSAGRGASFQDARALEAEMFRDFLKHLPGRKKTLREAYQRWQATELPGLRSRKATANHAEHAAVFFGERPLEEAPTIADAIKQDGLRRGISNATINRRVAVVIRLCNLAYQWGWIDQPIAERIHKLPEHNARHFYLEPEQVEALAKACYDPEAGQMIRMAAWSGLRRGELFRLTPDWLRDGVLLVPATKSRQRAVPIPGCAVDLVRKMPFALTDAQLRGNWDQARERTRLTEFRFHDLRHTYASWLIQSGASLAVVQEVLGHSTPVVTRRYAHLEVNHLKAAVQQMAARKGLVRSDQEMAEGEGFEPPDP